MTGTAPLPSQSSAVLASSAGGSSNTSATGGTPPTCWTCRTPSTRRRWTEPARPSVCPEDPHALTTALAAISPDVVVDLAYLLGPAGEDHVSLAIGVNLLGPLHVAQAARAVDAQPPRARQLDRGLRRRHRSVAAPGHLERGSVAVRATRGTRATLEKGVAGEHTTQLGRVETNRPRGVTGRVQHLQPMPATSILWPSTRSTSHWCASASSIPPVGQLTKCARSAA